ncbi:LysR family transcriptional regulator [Marinisporobacter balticus]|uniref:DNA-binding transcriptional LysR family regulator n=1 Tax=Marinisporobacter balticus TaxID=2018667 RepID=A0A4R2KGZ1_9FIRM|nr:LysR family transcriptional regulator [Marinisporobacter balticus]TCO69248.1 DNA-binding transcriptional LysR family regulator [Marinisporobacter balticus]
MSLYSYKIFDAVVRHQSFMRAAESVNLTPSAVSRSIAALETSLGFQLFIRSRKGVQLTREGENLIPTVRSVLIAEEQLQQVAAQINGLEQGTVVIGTFSSVCSNWIPGIVKSFRKLYPKIHINIMQGDYEDVVHWTNVGIVDIGFASLPVNEDLHANPLFEDRLLCITPKDFLPKNPQYVTIDDMQNQTFVLQREGYNADTISFIKKYNISIQPEFFIDDDQSILAIVESGLGISVVPELILKKVSFDIKVYPFKPNEFRTIGLITNQKQMLSPATKKLYNHIIAYINKHVK